ncbi:hypothetical protein BKA64DRAFT_72864 [Cadophora sp. MPI-SDFR-AT-0126]|nr:hypothetical protein BKA64DRAFT_72864 [Leotiomycetes sp. MPI-SDFR-AT-0126]
MKSLWKLTYFPSPLGLLLSLFHLLHPSHLARQSTPTNTTSPDLRISSSILIGRSNNTPTPGFGFTSQWSTTPKAFKRTSCSALPSSNLLLPQRSRSPLSVFCERDLCIASLGCVKVGCTDGVNGFHMRAFFHTLMSVVKIQKLLGESGRGRGER